jgi:hypothetical protein
MCLVLFVVLWYREGPHRIKADPFLAVTLIVRSPAVGLGATALVHLTLK